MSTPDSTPAQGGAAAPVEFDDVTEEGPSGHVMLGEPSYCETCGTNMDSLEWYLEDGTIEIRLQEGCYGGENPQFDDVDDAVAYLTELGKRFDRDVRLVLDDEAASMREKVTAYLS